MIKVPLSIRRKILIGYILFITVITIGAAFTYLNLKVIEEQVLFGNVTSDFFDTILEIRRFEKNYFLYRTTDEYKETLYFVNKSEQLLQENQKGFDKLLIDDSTRRIGRMLRRYKALLSNDFELNASVGSSERLKLETTIRKMGKEIVTVAKEMSQKEHQYIQKLLFTLHRALLVSIAFLFVFGAAVGLILFKTVSIPLKLLEKSMDKISSGKLQTVSIQSSDREIVSFREAFNKMLRELEMRQRQLVHSEKLASLGTLLSGVAHELNNPLSNISTSYQILNEELEEADTEYKRQLLSQIGEQTDRARDIVRSILDFSRLKDLDRKLLNLRDLIGETIFFIRSQIPTHVDIHVDVPDEIEIDADKQRIQQVFLNLIKNAIDAIADDGSVTITARSVAGESEPDCKNLEGVDNYHPTPEDTTKDYTVYIKIQDTGMGVPPEVITKIFDPFFTTKDVGKGSGLGLFVTHSIIEEHDGSIKAESKIGRGTSFLICLPQLQTPPKEDTE
jgi:signal transduction histidine kinase